MGSNGSAQAPRYPTGSLVRVERGAGSSTGREGIVRGHRWVEDAQELSAAGVDTPSHLYEVEFGGQARRVVPERDLHLLRRRRRWQIWAKGPMGPWFLAALPAVVVGLIVVACLTIGRTPRLGPTDDGTTVTLGVGDEATAMLPFGWTFAEPEATGPIALDPPEYTATGLSVDDGYARCEKPDKVCASVLVHVHAVQPGSA